MVLEAVSVATAPCTWATRPASSSACALQQHKAAPSGKTSLPATTYALTHHSNLRQAEEQLAPCAQQLRSRTPSVAAVSPRCHRSPHRSRSQELTQEAFWGPQNSALFPTEDRSARDLPTIAGDHIRDFETQKRIAEGLLVTAQLVMHATATENAQVRRLHSRRRDDSQLQHSQVQTGIVDGRNPLKLMVACFGPGGANPGETIGYAAFIETLLLVVLPIVNS